MPDLIGKDQIAEISRYTDAESEEFEDMPRFWRKRGVDVEAVTHVAMQHGLRQVMILKGMSPNLTKPTPIALSPAEQDIQVKFAGAWMTGLAVGFDLKAKHPDAAHS